ncbi:MAG: biotin--[acetyl-CoA-carboxylase] ligase [Calditrichaeota bacterium]|nr:biotin--[acetyl-CoA-carboxylase] ligase [Calditrichota bacterium]
MLNESRIWQHLAYRQQIRLDVFDVLDSTNRYLQEQVHQGAPDWTVAIADQQTAGQGRQQRSWESPPVVGLWFSILRRRPMMAQKVHLMNIFVAVTLARSLEEWVFRQERIPIQVQLKWPNDLWLTHRKMGGILIQGSFTGGEQDFLVLGIGLNINQQETDFSAEIRDTAISLRMATGVYWEREPLFAHLLNELYREFQGWDNLEPSALIAGYWDRLLFKNQEVYLRLQNEAFQARIVGITNDGLLVVQRPGKGEMVIASGEIVHLRGGTAHATGH